MGMSRPDGFALIELMVTIAVAGILLAVAVPSFESVVNGNRLSAAANEMMASLQTARMEAIRRNRRTILCLSAAPDNGSSPSCSTTRPTGWIVFRDDDKNGSPSAAELVRATTTPQRVLMLASSAFGGKVTFRADGLARDAAGNVLRGAMQFCLPTNQPAQNIRYITVNGGSRVASKTATGNNACPTTVGNAP